MSDPSHDNNQLYKLQGTYNLYIKRADDTDTDDDSSSDYEPDSDIQSDEEDDAVSDMDDEPDVPRRQGVVGWLASILFA